MRTACLYVKIESNSHLQGWGCAPQADNSRDLASALDLTIGIKICKYVLFSKESSLFKSQRNIWSIGCNHFSYKCNGILKDYLCSANLCTSSEVSDFSSTSIHVGTTVKKSL